VSTVKEDLLKLNHIFFTTTRIYRFLEQAYPKAIYINKGIFQILHPFDLDDLLILWNAYYNYYF
jgi:hypothetical protein